MDWKKVSLFGVAMGIIAALLWWAGVDEVIAILKGARIKYLVLAFLYISWAS